MAKSFNLTAQINLQGPANLKPVVNNIQKQLSGITANVKLNIDPKASKNITNITQKLQAMNAVLIQARTNTNALNNSLTSLGSSLNSAGKAGSTASNGVSKAASSAQAAAKSIKQAGTEMQEFGKQSALAIRRFAAFSVATGGIYGLINAVNSGVKAFINFDRELIKLQQVTGRGITGISALEKEITTLATTLGISSESLASVAITLAQAGLSAEETRVALAALAKTELAPSFDNLTDTTEGLIAALRQFDLQASESEKVLSSINAVSKAFAVESKDIIAAIQRTGGVFASASKGVSEGSDALNEFIAIFTSVRQTTRESAETIATGLRTIFTRIQRQSTVEALDELGIKLRDVDGQFVGAYEAIRRLSDGLNRLDPRSREFAAISEELGGFRQIGKVIPLIQQFAVAQEALRVAQKGQGSLTEDQVTAQKSLANQLAKVREQFLALIREVGKSAVFQGFFKIVVSLSSALISLAGAFKPILPLLGILGAVKGVSAIGQFATGFFGGLKKTGGAGAVGSNVASSVTGSASKGQQDALNQAASAIKSNTTAIQSLTGAINKLTPAVSGNSADIKANIDNVNTSVKNLNTALVNGVNALGKVIQNLGKGGGGTKVLNDGGKVLGFARGGVVPGSGNRDTVPAMLQPGEFVIRKKAVQSIGTDKLRDMNKYAIGGRVEDEIESNMNVSRISDRKNIKAFGLAGLYAGSTKADSFGVSGQKNIKLFQGTSKEEDAVLYTSSLNTSIKGQGTEEIEEALKESYIKSVNKFAKALAGKIQGQASNVKDILDEQAFSVVSGNAFEAAIRAIGAPFLEKTEKTKALDFPLGLGQAANLFGNIPSNIPTDVTRTIGGKGKGETAIVGQIERFLEAVKNKEFTKAKYGGTFPLQIAEAIENITAQALTAEQIREKISAAQDAKQKSAVNRYLKLRGVGNRGTQTKSLKDIYEKQAKFEPDALPVVEEGILALANIVLGRAAGGKANDTVPALLTPGEFVVNKKSAQKIGYARLNKLNQADKIKGYNKGGIVGFQRFADGGKADRDAVRAQGTVLKNLQDAQKAMAMSLQGVAPDIRDGLLKIFKGIEDIGTGGKLSIASNHPAYKFGASTRGQALVKRSSDPSKTASAMGLRISDTSGPSATTETAAHETGHLVDAAISQAKGFGQAYASKEKGTFQYDLMEKVKPIMQAAFERAGESSSRIANYLTLNEELFAEFFAKASPEIKKILTSTTDAAKGMEQLKKHLETTGETTYAGLSAADIVIPSGMPPIPPAPPPNVPPNPPGVPPSGPTPPSPLPPGPGGSGSNTFNFANENDREFFAYRAKQAGKSVGAYRTDAARKIAIEQRNIQENQRGKREETKFAFQGQASETGKNLRALEAAKGGSAADAKKYSDALKTAMREAEAKLKEIAPNLSGSELKKASKELVRAMMNGESINDAISKSGSALEKAFNDNIDSAKALDMAIENTAKELNISADQLRGNLSDRDIPRQQFITGEIGQKFGRAAQFAPDALEKFSGTKTGQATLKAADFLSGKGLTGKLEKSLGNAGKFIGDKIEALGGPMVVLGSTVAMAADQINKAFDGIKDPTTAGVVGGIGGAGSGLASGALLGGQIAGPVGAMIGGISGAIIGGIDGAFKAFNEARLAKNLKDLEKSAEGSSIALKEFETNQTDESARALLDATMSGQDAIRDLAQTAQIQYGEPTWARAIENVLGNLPVISNIMGTAQRGESVQALDQRAAMVLGNFERFGQRQLSRAPTDQVEDVIRRANEAADAAGTDDTEAGRDARAAARRGVYAQANQTYQTMARKGYTDNDIFKAMGRQELLQKGKSAQEISQMDEKDVIKAGKDAAAASAEAAFKQQQMANAIRETNRSVESLLDIFRVATAGLDRFNYELGLIATKAEDTASALSGNATLGPVDRTNEQVLGNISAYSMDEVKAVAANIGSLAGGEGGEKLQNQVVAAKVLQDELPKILRNTSSEGVEGVTSQLRDVFKNLSIEAPEGLFTNIAKTLEEKTDGRQGVSLADLADDTDFLGTASKVSAEALALAAKYANAFNNAMQQATDQANQYAKSLDEATQWQLRAADIRARADIQLAETLGKNLSLAEQAAPFENRIRGLSGGVIAGGSVDPNDIYQAMISATEDRKSMQEELAARQQTLQVNPEDKNAQKAVADQTRLIAEQNNKINNANKALEELANDSSRAADALNKLNELNKVAAGSVNFLQKALTSDSKSLIQMNKQLQDYTKFVSGQATTGDVNNLQFRQNVFAGLEDISSMMPASLAQQMQAKVARGMIESMPGGQALLQQTTGAIGPDGEAITFDSALNMMAEGKDPAQERYIQAYEAATQAQANAADRLGDAALLVAKEFNNSLQKTIAAVGTLPATMREAMGQANAPPGGENKPDDKDQTVQLVMDQAELDRIRNAMFGDLPTLGFDPKTAGTLDTTMQKLVAEITLLTAAVIALTVAYSAVGGIKGIGDLVMGRRRRRKRGSKSNKNKRTKGTTTSRKKKKTKSAPSTSGTPTKKKKTKSSRTKSAPDVSSGKPNRSKRKTPKGRKKGGGGLFNLLDLGFSALNIASGEGTIEDYVYGAMDLGDVVSDTGIGSKAKGMLPKIPGVSKLPKSTGVDKVFPMLGKLLLPLQVGLGAYQGLSDTEGDAAQRSSLEKALLGIFTGSASTGDSIFGSLFGAKKGGTLDSAGSGFGSMINSALLFGAATGYNPLGLAAGAVVGAGAETYKQGGATAQAVQENYDQALKTKNAETAASISKSQQLSERGKVAGVDVSAIKQAQLMGGVTEGERIRQEGTLLAQMQLAKSAGSLEDLKKKGIDTSGYVPGSGNQVSSIDDFVKLLEYKLEGVRSERTKELDVANANNSSFWNNLWGIKDEQASGQMAVSNDTRDKAIKQQSELYLAELKQQQAMMSTTDSVKNFQTALDGLSNILSKLIGGNVDNNKPSTDGSMPEIQDMAKKATTKGSIYTHDIHLESLLKALLGQDSSASELAKNLPNLTKGLSGSIGATGLDFRKNAFAELDFIKNIIPEDLFSQVSSQMSGFMIKSLPDSSTILKSVMGFADGKEMTLESILGGSGGDFIGSIQSLIGDKSTNVLDLVNSLLPQQFKDLFNIFDKPEQTTNESCECKILKEILATLKGQSTPAQINKQAAVAAAAAAEKTVTSKPTGIGTLDGGVAADKDKEKIVKGAVIQAPKAPGTEKSANNSVASMFASGGFGTMTLPKSADSPAKLKAILESKRNKYAAAGSKLSKNQITKEEYDKIKGEYKESRGRYGFATSNQIASPYQQQQSNRREAYLATKNPAVREKLMTDAEKQQRDLLEKQKREELEKQKAQPVPSALPTIRGGGSLDGGVAGDRSAIGSGPTGQSLGTVITVDQSATNLLEGLKTTFNSFNSYIDKLATVASTIPNEINLVGSYDLNVNITGAAAFENLSKEMQSVAEAIIRPKLEQLRDEISQATKGAVKSSASMGYRGDVNPTSAQGMA